MTEPVFNDYDMMAFRLGSSGSVQRHDLLVEALAPFRLSVLEELSKFGVRISFQKEGIRFAAGHFNPLNKAINIDPSMSVERQKGTIQHELGHAYAHLKRRRATSFVGRLLTFSSLQDAPTCDPKFRGLYGDYLTRSAVDTAVIMRDKFRAELKADALTKPVEASIAMGPYKYDLTYQPAECKKDGTEEITMARPFSAKKLALKAVLGLGGLGLVAKFAPPMVAAGFALVATYALLHRAVNWNRQRSFQSIDRTLQVPQQASVAITSRRTQVKMASAQPLTGAMFSDYAATARKPGEYYAEGVKHFLYSAQSREALRQHDRGLHDYIEAEGIHSEWLTAEGIPPTK